LKLIGLAVKFLAVILISTIVSSGLPAGKAGCAVEAMAETAMYWEWVNFIRSL